VATVVRILDLVEEELAVGFDRVDADRTKKFIEVFVEAANILFGNHGYLSSRHAVFRLYFHGFVLFSNFSIWCDATPVALDSMPDSNVLNMLVLISYVADCRFQTSWEASLIGFELYPAVVKLSDPVSLLFMSDGLRATQGTYQRLPIIVDDQIADVDLILSQFVEGIEYLLLGQVLANTIPSTIR
jgi:hypothetical protein